MKILCFAIFCVLAVVNSGPVEDWQSLGNYEEYDYYHDDAPKMKTAPENVTELNTEKPNNTEEMVIDKNCEELGQVSDHSVKRIITSADIIHSCVKDFVRVLDSTDGILIIIGSEKSDSALAHLHLKGHSNVYYNKYYTLPENVKSLRRYVYNPSELDIKVYVTAKQITEQLHALVIDDKYDEAVELSKYLYTETSDGSGVTIITNIVNRLLESEDYAVMNYAYKLIQNDANSIVSDCFPSIFGYILNGRNSNIRNSDKTGMLRLSPERDSYNDRWLYSDCYESDYNDAFWMFNPIWNSTLNSVMFEIHNVHYDMKLKLDWNPIGHYNDDRLAWGDERPEDPIARFEWRLMPTGFELNKELLFCIYEETFSSYLIPNSCQQRKEDVIGKSIVKHCNPKVGWNLY